MEQEHLGNNHIFLLIIYLFICILIPINSYAYDEKIKEERLTSEISVFSGMDIITDYHSFIVKIFSKAYGVGNERVLIRSVVLPSFKSEYVIGVAKRNYRYYAFKLVSKKQIWHEYQEALGNNTLDIFLQNEFPIVETEKEIPETMFRAIRDPWDKMLNLAMSKSQSKGLDGTSYHFSNSGLAAAYTWNPAPKSQAGYLVEIAELLGQLTLQNSNNQDNIEKRIFKTAQDLYKSFEE